jgi:uncharacterized protein YndB with AHSA1/START domain
MNDFGKLVDSSTVRFERLLPGPIERVWDYLTKPEFLATWLAQGSLDARAGGRVELRTIGGVVQGEITFYDPPRTLEYTWVSLPDPAPSGTPDSVVRFELEQRGEEILLTLTHRRLISEYLGRVGAGWHSLLDRLLSCMRGEEPEPFFDIFNRVRPGYEERAGSLPAS